jgi:hypothetical protein
MRPRMQVKLKGRPYFKRHGRTFSVLGLLIVLLTYVVKDVFQDKLKELRDSVAEAQRIEEIGDQNDQTILNQVELNLRSRQLNLELTGARIGGPIATGDLQAEVVDTLKVFSAEESRFQRVSKMLDMLPGNTEPLKKQRDELKIKLSTLKNDINKNVTMSLTAKNPNIGADILVVFGVIQVLVFDLELIPLQSAKCEGRGSSFI